MARPERGGNPAQPIFGYRQPVALGKAPDFRRERGVGGFRPRRLLSEPGKDLGRDLFVRFPNRALQLIFNRTVACGLSQCQQRIAFREHAREGVAHGVQTFADRLSVFGLGIEGAQRVGQTPVVEIGLRFGVGLREGRGRLRCGSLVSSGRPAVMDDGPDAFGNAERQNAGDDPARGTRGAGVSEGCGGCGGGVSALDVLVEQRGVQRTVLNSMRRHIGLLGERRDEVPRTLAVTCFLMKIYAS